MREHNRDRGRLEDILKYSLNVEQIVNGITFNDFVSDIRIYYSVMKNIEVIGEAANMLTKHFRLTYPGLPWRQIVAMRNVLVHGYAQVSDTDLWKTAKDDIRPLREQVQRYLSDIKWEEWAQLKDPYSEDTDNAVFKQMVQTARKMKLKGYGKKEIAEITGLTDAEIEAL